jgi:lysozyme
MNARAAIILGLAAFAGVAYAASRQRPDTSGEGVDWPDAPSDPLAWLDATAGEWGPTAIFGDAAALFGGNVMSGRLSYSGLAQLKDAEGFSHTPYPDHKGHSIAHGHLIKPGEDLTYVTREQGEQLLLADVTWAEEAVNASVHVPLTPNQFDALVLLAYNIGAPAFRSSTLVRLLNAGDYAGAAAQFPRWVYASGVVNTTLVARRDRERNLFEA